MSNSPARRRPKRRGCGLLALLAVLLLCVALFALGSGALGRAAYPKSYADLVERYADQNGLPRELVYAVIYCESGFDPEAVSSIGACGLMQMTEEAFEWVAFRGGEEFAEGYEQIFEPEVNIKFGCRMLGLLLEEYRTVPNALCAYHAGWGTARRWLEDVRYAPDGENIENIPYSDTAHYVKRVQKTAERYQRLYSL